MYTHVFNDAEIALATYVNYRIFLCNSQYSLYMMIYYLFHLKLYIYILEFMSSPVDCELHFNLKINHS